ncbi:MAG TPA: ATP-binding protein [Terriglobales bacterium]|nr:ATP-binding protein [Terriglobales bacterium]
METIGRLISGVAHDFNNLLTGIVLCSDLLMAGLPKSSSLRRYAEEIRTASAQGASMIQHLLVLARQGTGEPTLVSLNQVVESMRALLARLIGENLELQLDLAADLNFVRMDPSELQEIILNLVLNARDAMPYGGQISIVTRNGPAVLEGDSAGAIELAISDKGVGMDANTLARAFDPFFTTKEIGQGTGLGLATVRRIVMQQEGKVEIESEPGKGTRVIVHLPATEPDQRSRTPNRRKTL